MTELDEIALFSRLRALRADPPDGDFEQRLLARLNAVELQPVAPPVRPLPRRRRAASLAAAGVLLIGTSAAAWFTGVVLPARSAQTKAAPAADGGAKAARRAHHAHASLPPPVAQPLPGEPAAEPAPQVQPAHAEPAQATMPVTPHVEARPDLPRVRVHHGREATEAVERRSGPTRTPPAPIVATQQPGSENVRLVMPERVQMSAPPPAVPAEPEWNERRSRGMQERVRNAEWERRDLREANPAAEHKERAEQTGREHSARELHRSEARERHEHPAKK